MYFGLANQSVPLLWLDEKRIEVSNLVWFYEINMPNVAALFVLYFLFMRERKFLLGVVYLVGLYWEQFFIGADYMGSYEGVPLTIASYNIFTTELNFSDIGNHKILHFTVLFALFQLTLILIRKIFEKVTGEMHGNLG